MVCEGLGVCVVLGSYMVCESLVVCHIRSIATHKLMSCEAVCNQVLSKRSPQNTLHGFELH